MGASGHDSGETRPVATPLAAGGSGRDAHKGVPEPNAGKALAEFKQRLVRSADGAGGHTEAAVSTVKNAAVQVDGRSSKVVPDSLRQGGSSKLVGSERRSAVQRAISQTFAQWDPSSAWLLGVLATEIEQALNATLGNDEKAYAQQARAVLFNLRDPKNTTFRSKLMGGSIAPADVPSLSAEDMASSEKQAAREKMRKESMEEVQTDWDLKHGAANISGLFFCGRCKGTKTTYYQLQTRSSDEPMTTFVTCLKCGKRWKC